MVFHAFQGLALIPCFWIFCFRMGENHVEGIPPSYCVGHCVTHVADPNSIRICLSILGSNQLIEEKLPKIDVWLLQYPRDNRILSDFIGINSCPIRREPGFVRFFYGAIKNRFARNRVNPFDTLRSERDHFRNSRSGHLPSAATIRSPQKMDPSWSVRDGASMSKVTTLLVVRTVTPSSLANLCIDSCR